MLYKASLFFATSELQGEKVHSICVNPMCTKGAPIPQPSAHPGREGLQTQRQMDGVNKENIRNAAANISSSIFSPWRTLQH